MIQGYNGKKLVATIPSHNFYTGANRCYALIEPVVRPHRNHLIFGSSITCGDFGKFLCNAMLFFLQW